MNNEKVIFQAEKIANILNQEKANEKAVIYIEHLYKEWNKCNE